MAAGSVPAPVVSLGFKATAATTYLKKPKTLWNRRDERDFLGQIQAVDHIMNTPGLTDDEKIAMLGATAEKLLRIK